MLHRLCILLVSGFLATTSRASPPDGADEGPKKPSRILLFAHVPTRDYHFVRTLFVREVEKGSAELSIHLQLCRRDDVDQGVPPSQLLKDFPRYLLPEKDAKEPAFDRLSSYDVIIAFDPLWTALNKEQAELLRTWVGSHGGGLIVVAGPIGTRELTRPREQERLKAVVDLLPVVLENDLLHRERSTAAPSRLIFRAGDPQMTFLTLDEDGKQLLSGWEQFFTGKASKEEGEKAPLRFGFHDAFPVLRAKSQACVVATFPDPPNRVGQPYLVTMPYGKGRVVFIGSGETWRLRQYRESYHARFWMRLVAYAAAGERTNTGSFLVLSDEAQVGETVTVEARMIKPSRDPFPFSVPLRGRVSAPDGVQLPRATFALLPVRDREKWDGWFRGHVTLTDPGEYRIEVAVPDSRDVLKGKVIARKLGRIEDITPMQERVLRRFRDVQRGLLSLARQLESSKLKENQEYAPWVREAIELASAGSLGLRFEQQADLLDNVARASVQKLQGAIEQGELLESRMGSLQLLLVRKNAKPKITEEDRRLLLALAALAQGRAALPQRLQEHRNQLDLDRQQLDLLRKELKKIEGFKEPSSRIKELEDDLASEARIIRDMGADSRDLLRELKAGQVRPWLVSTEARLCDALESLAQSFAEAQPSLRQFRVALETGMPDPLKAERAVNALGKLVEQLDKTQATMADLMTLAGILAELSAIEEAQRQQVGVLRRMKLRLIEALLQDAASPDRP